MNIESVNKSSFAACKRALKPGGTYLNVVTPLPGPAMLLAKLAGGKKI